MVTAGVIGHSAMTGIHETCMGNEITMLYEEKLERRINKVHTVTSSLPQSGLGDEPVRTT